MSTARPHETILRHSAGERITHWLLALFFFTALLSGFALFHPALFWMTNFFGGGTWTRILHPIFGVLMCIAFTVMAVAVWSHTRMTREDWRWLGHMRSIVTNREEGVPEVGHYNAGQKLLLVGLIVCMAGLLMSGILMWRSLFWAYFDITAIRIGSLAHAVFAFVLVCSVIVHVYSSFWIKGSIDSMLRGNVTPGWAWKHHRGWFREITHAQDPGSRSDRGPV